MLLGGSFKLEHDCSLSCSFQFTIR